MVIEVYFSETGHWVGRLDEILSHVRALVAQGENMAGEMERLQAEVSESASVIDSAIALIRGIKAALDAAGTDRVALNTLSDSLDAKEQELSAAILENTPAADVEPPPVVEEPVV